MLTADCAVLNCRNEVLLVRRGNAPFIGSWALPGGFMEMDETIEQCAVRELEEETGLRFPTSRLRLVGVFSAPGRDPRGRTVTAAYVIDGVETDEAKAGDDAAAVAWFPLDQLPPLAFDHDEVIRKTIELLNY